MNAAETTAQAGTASGVRIFTGKLHRIQRRHGKAFVDAAPAPSAEPVRRPARVAIMLALAHKIQDAIDRGVVRDCADVAMRLGLSERLQEAVTKLRETMLQNRFLLPRLLGKNFDGLDISPDSDELEMMYLDDIPEEYLDIWNAKELLCASTLYDGELSTVRARYIEIKRELEHEPRGERRSRLVKEPFGMRRSNRQDHPDWKPWSDSDCYPGAIAFTFPRATGPGLRPVQLAGAIR